MDIDEILATYDRQLRIEIEIPGLQKEVTSNLVRFVRPAPGMNYVSYSRLDEREMDTVIQEQIAYFSQMDQPFSWHVYDHDLPQTIKERLVANGFVPDDDPDAVMVLDLAEAPSAIEAPVDFKVRQVGQKADLDDVTLVEQAVYGGDFAWLKGRLGPHLEIPGYLSVYVAYVDGQPACTGWIYFHPRAQFASLFGGATVAEYRQRGLYSAVLAVRLSEAIRREYKFVTTGASAMSRPILAKNGFHTITYAHDYEWGGYFKSR